MLLAFAVAFLLAWPAASIAADQPDPAYLADLIRRAADARLADQRYWHLLLHYRKNLWGGYTSEADDPGFFLAPEGKTNPQAELNATLAKFFSADPVGRSKQPAQCAFIARYTWLKEQLGWDERRLPPIPCERFHNWYAELNPQSITLIFPSAYMNNPSSMFGHTLIRVDQKGQTEQTRILAYTINYAADVPENEGVSFAIKGVFGGYKGYFSTIPYYLKVQEYRDIENRDIWEYRLNLSEEQIRRLLMHAWELGNAYFDYFFFKENCSYHLLSLIEVANPDWHLTDHFLFWTVPADTVRLLTQQPGLVGDIVYRPSRSTQIKRKRERLSDEERERLLAITSDVEAVKSSAFQGLPIERQAFVLDLASDYMRYRSVSDEGRASEYKEKNRAILAARSERRVRSEDFKILPFTDPPEQGHRTSRAGVGFGWRNDELFEELNLRAGYHDLLDPERGYQRDAQIELLGAALRHYERSGQVRLERFTAANILSLSPMDTLFKSPSWKINVGMQSIHHNDCRYCSAGIANGGIGAAVEAHLIGREVFFAFVEIESAYSGAYNEHYRVGGGGTLGVTAALTERWKLLLSTTYLKFPLGERTDDWRVSFGQRYTIQRNFALRAEFNHRDHHDNEVLFLVHAYF
ncbi:Lnb N-terminal periplasmic domain-containing protein [Candidatus Nitrospira bockiana]